MLQELNNLGETEIDLEVVRRFTLMKVLFVGL